MQNAAIQTRIDGDHHCLCKNKWIKVKLIIRTLNEKLYTVWVYKVHLDSQPFLKYSDFKTEPLFSF